MELHLFGWEGMRDLSGCGGERTGTTRLWFGASLHSPATGMHGLYVNCCVRDAVKAQCYSARPRPVPLRPPMLD